MTADSSPKAPSVACGARSLRYGVPCDLSAGHAENYHLNIGQRATHVWGAALSGGAVSSWPALTPPTDEETTRG